MNDETDPCASVIWLRVRDGDQAAFLTWQARMAEAAAAAPGFVSIEFIPVLRSRDEWQIVTHFCDPRRLLEWRASPRRALLGRELEALVEGALPPEEEAPQVDAGGSVTEVITTRVQSGREAAFRDWSMRIQRAQAEFPGYRGTYLQAPSREQAAWTTLVRFATTRQLDAWLASAERRRLLEESTALVESWSSRRLTGPFAGWFPPEAAEAAPASWKQSMIVLLALFPIVMVELRFLMPRLHRLDLVFSTFLGNAISVWLLTWPTMPLVNRAFDWWLRPNAIAARWITPVGIGLLFGLYAIEIATFFWIV